MDDELRIQLEDSLGSFWLRLNRIDEVIVLAQRQYVWASGCGSIVHMNAATIRMAEAHLNAEHYDFALAYAEEAHGLALQLGDPVRQADALINAARALLGLGLFDDAEQRLGRAETLTTEAHDVAYRAKAQLFLGHAAAAREAWAAALARFEAALLIVEGYGDRVGRGVVLSNMGRALTELGRWDEAEAVLQDALSILHYHGNRPTEDMCRQRLQRLRVRMTAASIEYAT